MKIEVRCSKSKVFRLFADAQGQLRTAAAMRWQSDDRNDPTVSLRRNFRHFQSSTHTSIGECSPVLHYYAIDSGTIVLLFKFTPTAFKDAELGGAMHMYQGKCLEKHWIRQEYTRHWRSHIFLSLKQPQTQCRIRRSWESTLDCFWNTQPQIPLQCENTGAVQWTVQHNRYLILGALDITEITKVHRPVLL